MAVKIGIATDMLATDEDLRHGTHRLADDFMQIGDAHVAGLNIDVLKFVALTLAQLHRHVAVRTERLAIDGYFFHCILLISGWWPGFRPRVYAPCRATNFSSNCDSDSTWAGSQMMQSMGQTLTQVW